VRPKRRYSRTPAMGSRKMRSNHARAAFGVRRTGT
jgi:hypothetical protein